MFKNPNKQLRPNFWKWQKHKIKYKKPYLILEYISLFFSKRECHGSIEINIGGWRNGRIGGNLLELESLLKPFKTRISVIALKHLSYKKWIK